MKALDIPPAEAPCPVCGRPMHGVPPQALLHLDLPRLPKLILETLVAVHPRPVPAKQLVDSLWWDDPEGGPENPVNNIAVHVKRLNPILRLYGWEIRGPRSGGPAAGRRLYRVEEAHE